MNIYTLLLVNLPLVLGMIIFMTRQQLAALIEAQLGWQVSTLVFTGVSIGLYLLWMGLYFPLRYKQYQEMVERRKK